jgi:hypothetical protein
MLLGINYGDVTLGVIQDNPLVIDEEKATEVVTSQESNVEDIVEIEEQVEEINE